MSNLLLPHARNKLGRRDFLKVAGAGLAASALPAFPATAQEKVKLLLWSWLPDFQTQVDMFSAAHPNIEVELVNAGQGGPQYANLRAGMQAGSGLPDVTHMEFQFINSFRQTDAFLDIGEWANAHKGAFPAGSWNQVSEGDAVYAMPWDSGPMALLYRTDILEQHGIQPPATWGEFAESAIKLHEADANVFLTNAPFTQGGWVNALLWQAGWHPIKRNGAELTIAINDQIAKDFATYWQGLIDAGAIETQPDFTTEWYTGLDEGRYATWIAAGWGPVFLSGVAANSSGKWRASDLPQKDASSFVTSNWGGSTLAVMKNTKHPAEAAELAIWLTTNPEATTLYTTKQFLFPTLTSILESPEFAGQKNDFYGGQAVNEVFAKSSKAIDLGFEWSPFQDYFYQAMSDEFGASLAGNGTLADAFDRIQASVATFASDQGFTVV
jgi:multiple sugar transport system substrate-binding protein